MNWLVRAADIVDARKNPRNYQIFLLVLFSLLVLAAGIATAASDQVRVGGVRMPPLCLFKLSTGLDCPACGITRALILAFHGHWKDSYLLHIWGLPLAGLILLQFPYRVYMILGGAPARVPARVRVWTFRFVVLSLLLPWFVKTALHFV